MKVREVIPLLNELSTLLSCGKAQKKSLEGLSELVHALEQVSDMEIKQLVTLMKSPQNNKRKISSKKQNNNLDFELVKNIKEKVPVSVSEQTQVELENYKKSNPHLDLIIATELSDLYEVLFSIGTEGWTINELKLIHYLFFGGKEVVGKKTKKQLFDLLLNNTYQHNYSSSIKKNFKSKHNDDYGK